MKPEPSGFKTIGLRVVNQSLATCDGMICSNVNQHTTNMHANITTYMQFNFSHTNYMELARALGWYMYE